MVEFDLWRESFIFGITFIFIIGIPCVITTLMGLRIIDQLGRYPSKASQILLKSFWPFISLMAFTFAILLAFFKVFE